MVDLIAIQKEQVEWSERNFGKQHARYPLMGMIEECLEFDAAWKALEDLKVKLSRPAPSPDELLTSPELYKEMSEAEIDAIYAAVYDAIGDISIYMLDYCGKVSVQLNELWTSRDFFDERTRNNWYDLTPMARMFAHHQLKGEQGIRGTPEAHAREIQRACRAVLAHLEFICRYLHKDYLGIVDTVWSKVRLRDWTKHKDNAHEVAEGLAAT